MFDEVYLYGNLYRCFLKLWSQWIVGKLELFIYIYLTGAFLIT